MRCRFVVAKNRCDVHSTGETQKMHILCRRLTWTLCDRCSEPRTDGQSRRVHAWPYACAFNCSLRIGGFVSSLLVSPWLLACWLSGLSWTNYSVSTSSRSSVSLIISPGSSSSGLVLSVSCVMSSDIASGTWCLIAAGWVSSN